MPKRGRRICRERGNAHLTQNERVGEVRSGRWKISSPAAARRSQPSARPPPRGRSPRPAAGLPSADLGSPNTSRSASFCSVTLGPGHLDAGPRHPAPTGCLAPGCWGSTRGRNTRSLPSPGSACPRALARRPQGGSSCLFGRLWVFLGWRPRHPHLCPGRQVAVFAPCLLSRGHQSHCTGNPSASAHEPFWGLSRELAAEGPSACGWAVGSDGRGPCRVLRGDRHLPASHQPRDGSSWSAGIPSHVDVCIWRGEVVGSLGTWRTGLGARRAVAACAVLTEPGVALPWGPCPRRPPPPAEMPDGPADTCFSATEALNCVRAPPAGRPGARQVLPALPFVTRRWLSGGQCPCPPRRAAPRETTPAGRSSVKGSTTDKRTHFLTSTWACSESPQHFLELSRKVLEESGVFRGTVGSLMLMMPMIILAPRSSLPRPLTCSEASTSGGRAVSRTRGGRRQDRRLVRAPAGQGASRPSPRAAPCGGGRCLGSVSPATSPVTLPRRPGDQHCF